MNDHLQRRIGPVLLTAYGVGVMVGAGIYVLVGAVAGAAGVWAPLAFLLAGLVALPSALAYAELSTRMPEAAGEAAFVEAGYGKRWLAIIVGIAIVVAGIISGAAVLRGGIGYLSVLLPFSPAWMTVFVGLALIAVAVIGVLESMMTIAVFTLLEVGGLIVVSWAGLSADPVAEFANLPAPDWSGIATAIAICFFAFIGFEDLANMAEEVREPEINMPRSLLMSVLVTAVLYALVSYAAARSVPRDLLNASTQPLALVWEMSRGGSAGFLSAIAVAAAVNGVLAQIIMAARVLFGLGRRTPVLAIFTNANPQFGTPIRATFVVGGAVILAAVALPVSALAQVTSFVLLVVFLLVNGALILLKRESGDAPFRLWAWVPWAGLLSAAAAILAAYGGIL